jgi:hypothetical protein
VVTAGKGASYIASSFGYSFCFRLGDGMPLADETVIYYR